MTPDNPVSLFFTYIARYLQTLVTSSLPYLLSLSMWFGFGTAVWQVRHAIREEKVVIKTIDEAEEEDDEDEDDEIDPGLDDSHEYPLWA